MTKNKKSNEKHTEITQPKKQPKQYIFDKFMVRDVGKDFVILNVDGRSFKVKQSFNTTIGQYVKVKYTEKTKNKVLKNCLIIK